jgi:hypothetical protein
MTLEHEDSVYPSDDMITVFHLFIISQPALDLHHRILTGKVRKVVRTLTSLDLVRPNGCVAVAMGMPAHQGTYKVTDENLSLPFPHQGGWLSSDGALHR